MSGASSIFFREKRLTQKILLKTELLKFLRESAIRDVLRRFRFVLTNVSAFEGGFDFSCRIK
ncbi:hypothetical protein DLM77_20310 [Leptospira yasudae]|uniref:Uncharacterized protein n=1 Tax=Leptospira yasudae TaxID=2202201 RepID=A0ABX9LXL2_9LEPT|nr:hypothetical protein DLM77_20310 [Leptospira yasudae]